MMNKLVMALLVSSSLLAAPAMANRAGLSGHGVDADVVVPLPPQIWDNSGTNNQNSAPTCHRCCIYDNKSYSEGAVVTADSVVLQCVRDPQVVGTNDLKWQQLKK